MTVTELADWIGMTYYHLAMSCGVAFFAGLQLVAIGKLVLALAEWIGDTLTGRNRVTTRS